MIKFLLFVGQFPDWN